MVVLYIVALGKDAKELRISIMKTASELLFVNDSAYRLMIYNSRTAQFQSSVVEVPSLCG